MTHPDTPIYLAILTSVICFFLWIWDELKVSTDFSYLPKIHQPDGDRPFKDDWVIYKLGIKIPRWWFTKAAVFPPRILIGSKELRFNNAVPWKNEDEGLLGTKEQYKWPEWGPKPWQVIPGGAWYIAICYPRIFGLAIPLPTISITFKNLKAVRIGVRYSDGPSERYYEIFGLGTKDLNG